MPLGARRRQLLKRQPAPVADLDRIETVARRQQREDPPLKEGRVHAELQHHAATELRAQAVDQLAQEGHRLLRVVDVPRPVLQAQDVAGLSEVRDESVVARVFAMVGIEAAEGPGDLHAGAHDGPSTSMVRRGSCRAAIASVTRVWLRATSGARVSWVNCLSQLAMVRADGIRARPQKRVMSGRRPDSEMLQPPAADDEQGQEQQPQPGAAVVTAQTAAGLAQAGHEIDPVHVAAHQLQPTVGGEGLRHELDRKIGLDHPWQLATLKRIEGPPVSEG